LLDWINTLSPDIKAHSFIQEFEAYANFYLNNLEKSSELFKILFEKNPSKFQYLVHYGMCQVRLGKEDNVKSAFDAVKNRVKESQDLIILSKGYESIGEYETSIDLTFKALENDPNNPNTHLSFIYSFIKKEQFCGQESNDKYIKAFRKSFNNFSDRFPEEKGLQRFEMKEENIKDSQMFKAIDRMAKVTDDATNLYKESQAPIAFISKLTGRKPFDI